ncbi:MAG: hypothetical protein D6681_21405 [Calditrichaeota bacterium]|nr:MAG: hypothetical protein D6681_21405 [Calditrichota bacterium]
MTLEEFRASLAEDTPPAGLSLLLLALWQEAKGRWDEAHRLAQMDSSTDGARVHAYLHRKEGDLSNAAYWYSRAGRKPANLSLEEEWEQLVNEFLNRHMK